MIPRHLHVITTRRATSDEKKAAEERNIILHEMPVTRIELISPSSDQLRPLLAQQLPWVFTSRNGVAGCRHALGELADTVTMPGPSLVYAVGPGTAHEAVFGDVPVVVPDEHNAIGLARRILLDTQLTEVIHWCGVRRRPEFSERLSAADVSVHEVIVYDTLPEPDISVPSIKPDAVLFYSPSAVDALMENGLLPDWPCPLVAIGTTTADALQAAVAGLQQGTSKSARQPGPAGSAGTGPLFGSAGIYTAAKAAPAAMMEMAVQLNEIPDE
ncbi:MAG: uroporphyrinogen-III synthase [Balneolaceae bacterium]|nr:MAG: uroporphyrinogen-III synthase [Balneolaceae bacterium]